MTVMIEQDRRSAAVHHHVVRGVVVFRPGQSTLVSKIASYWTVWQLALSILLKSSSVVSCPFSSRWWFEETPDEHLSENRPKGVMARLRDVISGQKRFHVSSSTALQGAKGNNNAWPVMRPWIPLASVFLLDFSPAFVLGWISTIGALRPTSTYTWIIHDDGRRPNQRSIDRHEWPSPTCRALRAAADAAVTVPPPLSILVVDDEEGIRNAVGTLLQENGFTVCLCPDATSALEQLQRTNFDCVVSDVRMPGLSGLDLVQTLRTVESLRTVPVVLLTAAGRPDDRIAGYRAGADAYLPKPFDPDELVAIIGRLINRRISMTDIQDELAAISNVLQQQQQQQQQEQQSSSSRTTNIHLPPDEAKILEYVCEGWTTKEIAAKVYLSTRRIDQLLTVLFRKANVKNRTELVRWAVSTGLVKLS
jgi:DNA-binding NarL/FixJ family response regulator